jgi:hypothetical protein
MRLGFDFLRLPHLFQSSLDYITFILSQFIRVNQAADKKHTNMLSVVRNRNFFSILSSGSPLEENVFLDVLFFRSTQASTSGKIAKNVEIVW